MKFQIGDKVKEIGPPYGEATVMEATVDKDSSTGEWYLIDFGGKGNQWTDGHGYVVIETDFI